MLGVVMSKAYEALHNKGVFEYTPTPVYRYALMNCDTGWSIYGWSIKWVPIYKGMG